MNFYSIIIYGYCILAIFLIYIILRDLKQKGSFFHKKRILGITIGITIGIGILIAIDSYFIEPNLLLIKKTNIESNKISTPIKIALVTDIQVGNHKKTRWVEKIVKKIDKENPDLILLGGDLISNEGNFDNEEKYLEPLKKLSEKYPIYYILGNHEYGIGSYIQNNYSKHTADKSEWVIKKMEELNIPLLRNNLECLNIKNEDLCIFGTDDIWKRKIDYTKLESNHNKDAFNIFLTHNPDGILSYPQNLTPPNLVLAGHTHGGQVYIPFIGPLGDPDVKLSKKYWRGLNHYLPITILNDNKKTIPILTSVGVGESGGKLRLFTPPTIDIITIN